jgi:hypothetical protein
VQVVGIGKKTEFPPSPNTVKSCAKQRTGSRDVLPHPPPLSTSFVSAYLADPSNLAHIGHRSVGFGCRAALRIFGRRGQLGFPARPPGCSCCCLSDSAVQHRERGGASVPPTLFIRPCMRSNHIYNVRRALGVMSLHNSRLGLSFGCHVLNLSTPISRVHYPDVLTAPVITCSAT